MYALLPLSDVLPHSNAAVATGRAPKSPGAEHTFLLFQLFTQVLAVIIGADTVLLQF